MPATFGADGMFDKLAVGVNGSWPPPILNVQQGDTVRIHATNQLAGPTGTASVHHHGLRRSAGLRRSRGKADLSRSQYLFQWVSVLRWRSGHHAVRNSHEPDSHV